MSGDFLEKITEVLLSERIGEKLKNDIQYKAAISEEQRLYELLNNDLNEEQQNILQNYFDAANTTSAIVESLAYKQGMKDLLSLFRSLTPEGESKLLRISGWGQIPDLRQLDEPNRTQDIY